jgi:hypothetical protein
MGTDTLYRNFHFMQPGRSKTFRPEIADFRGIVLLSPYLEQVKRECIDGLTFLDGVLFVNTVMTGHIFRVPLDNGGKAGAHVDMKLSQPLLGRTACAPT